MIGHSVNGEVVIEGRDLVKRFGEREALFDGSSGELHSAVPEAGARDFEEAFVAFLRDRGH